MTLNDLVNVCHFPSLQSLPTSTWVCIYIYLYTCSMSTINLRCNFPHCSLSLSLSFYLSPSLPPFYPHPKASAFEEIQFEILSCIFHEPNLFFFLYLRAVLLLERCFIDVARERLWLYRSVSIYLLTVRASRLLPNPSGRLSLVQSSGFITRNKKPTFFYRREARN